MLKKLILMLSFDMVQAPTKNYQGQGSNPQEEQKNLFKKGYSLENSRFRNRRNTLRNFLDFATFKYDDDY